MKLIGVLGFQGSVEEHIQMLTSMNKNSIRVTSEQSLSQVDGLIIPGGESTTFLKILHFSNLYEPLLKKIKDGLPVMATCAGVILLASCIDHLNQESMHILPISVSRNGYGRQIASFCEEVKVLGLSDTFKAIFIRAPIITKTDESITILARDSNLNPIMVQKGNVIGLTFHPELTDDDRIHSLFIEKMNII